MDASLSQWLPRSDCHLPPDTSMEVGQMLFVSLPFAPSACVCFQIKVLTVAVFFHQVFLVLEVPPVVAVSSPPVSSSLRPVHSRFPFDFHHHSLHFGFFRQRETDRAGHGVTFWEGAFFVESLIKHLEVLYWRHFGPDARCFVSPSGPSETRIRNEGGLSQSPVAQWQYYIISLIVLSMQDKGSL